MSYPVQIYKVALTNLTILKLPGIFWQHYWYIHFQNHFASSCKVFFFKIISLQAQWKHMGTIGIWPNQRLLKSWLLKYVLVSRYVVSKGQIISKWFFGVFDFLQKTNKNKSIWGIIVVKSNFFVRFLEEIEDIKTPFEINWPLEAI